MFFYLQLVYKQKKTNLTKEVRPNEISLKHKGILSINNPFAPNGLRVRDGGPCLSQE